jgi:hypothetical protein
MLNSGGEGKAVSYIPLNRIGKRICAMRKYMESLLISYHCRMTLKEALITAARRYCGEHYHYWAVRYSKERTGKNYPVYSYSDNDYDLFPRYNILAAILGEVEILVGKPFPSLSDCRAALIQIGRSANSPLTDCKDNLIASAAIQQERDKFIQFINTVTPEMLEQTAPLPYRRRLEENEKRDIYQALLERWNYDGGYWDPIENLSPVEIIYIAKADITSADMQAISGFISDHAAPYLLETTEEGIITEISSGEFHLNSAETVFCDCNYQWLIYVSHEATVTFAGEQLLVFIKHLFAGRENLLYP